MSCSCIRAGRERPCQAACVPTRFSMRRLSWRNHSRSRRSPPWHLHEARKPFIVDLVIMRLSSHCVLPPNTDLPLRAQRDLGKAAVLGPWCA